MKRLIVEGILLLTIFCMVSCYPEEPECIHGKDVAFTHYDEQADFALYSTFVMPDSIVFIKSDGDSAKLDKETSDQLIALVKQNFIDRDYKLLTAKEAETQIPDFVVTVTVFSTPVFNDTNWGDYWGWYAGWSWFGWGDAWEEFYPWCPWYDGNYTYSTSDGGTLVVDMLDVKNVNSDSKHIPVLWSGASTGILAGNSVCFCDRLKKSINQCFVQSPYL